MYVHMHVELDGMHEYSSMRNRLDKIFFLIAEVCNQF